LAGAVGGRRVVRRVARKGGRAAGAAAPRRGTCAASGYKSLTSGNRRCMTAAEMTDALVQINDRLAEAARVKGSAAMTFFCECGDCLADEVRLSLDEHEEIRAREDLVFAPGHEAP